VRNDPHARKAVNALATNIVGTGIVPRAVTGDEDLNKRVDALWRTWSRTAKVDSPLDAYGIQALAVRSMVESGEVLLRRRSRRPEDGLPVPMQVQVLEGDMLDGQRTDQLANGRIVQGVEFDVLDRRRGYWLLPNHPGDIAVWGYSDASQFVPAAAIAHAYHELRPGQVRGVTWLSAILLQLRDLGAWRAAELVRKKIESCHVGVVEGDDESISDDGDTDPTINKVTDADGNVVEQLEPGMLLYAPRAIKFNQPGSVGGAAEYERVQLQAVAAGIDVPYFVLSSDLASVNFSAARAGLNEFRAYVDMVRWQIVVPMICEPMWRWFIAAAQVAGLLPEGDIAVEWDPPAWPSVNPLQDAQADLLEVRAGFASLAQKIAQRGYNARDILTEQAELMKLADKLGLVLDSDGRVTNKSGGLQPGAAASASSDSEPA
jgi:lambda family phage portal protein